MSVEHAGRFEHTPMATVRRFVMIPACSSVSRLVAMLRPALRANGLDTDSARDGPIAERPDVHRLWTLNTESDCVCSVSNVGRITARRSHYEYCGQDHPE
jgi:hypothetical protein